MSGKLTLNARLDQRLLMNQKLRQMITFLQYTTIELKEKIQELLEINPLVEVKEEQDVEAHEANLPDWMTFTTASKHVSYSDDEYDPLQMSLQKKPCVSICLNKHSIVILLLRSKKRQKC